MAPSATGSARVTWVVVKVGDKIPANAEILLNVDRDWIEVSPAANPNAVYEIHGPDSGQVIKKVADILKGKPKLVSFPQPKGATPDPKFKDKLVVTQYLGRQIYITADGDQNDIKYGDVLDPDREGQDHRHQQHDQPEGRERKDEAGNWSDKLRHRAGAEGRKDLQVPELQLRGSGH